MRESGTPRTVVIVGASSGIGAALACIYNNHGARVVALARRQMELAKLPTGIATIEHDVRDSAAVAALVERIEREHGPIDTLVYAAGAMPRITPDTWDTERDKEVIDTNVTGLMAWMNAVAPRLQQRGSGHLAAISSIAGDRGRRGFPAYCTSKAATNTYMESLRNRLARHGVKVTTIKPGFVDTAMTKGLEKLFWMASAETAAAQIRKAIDSGKHTRYVLRRWALVGLVIRCIPSFVFRRMDI
ncbi:MAG: SDR family NAD(P)-dependent oxidoreductase [Planctomycetes bacterium]|nr:SDR family NAD(P)-dependent oxidoreductase [Planctomycetota bacterium]